MCTPFKTLTGLYHGGHLISSAFLSSELATFFCKRQTASSFAPTLWDNGIKNSIFYHKEDFHHKDGTFIVGFKTFLDSI